jgi:hypothetical protein
MVSCCVAQKSFNSSIGDTTIDLCQHCLLSYLPFQSLDDLDYEFTVSNEINISEEEMDGLMHLKFMQSEINANLDKSLKINCEYYVPNNFKLINK